MAVRTLNPHLGFCASRLWTADLLGRGFFGHCANPTRAAKAYLSREINKGLVASRVIDAYPVPEISKPLYSGPPSREPESYGHLAYLAELRWWLASVSQRVYWATSRFSRIHASWTGGDRLTRPEMAGHDLAVTAVWLLYLEQHPEIALSNQWKSERQLQFEKRRGHKYPGIPDALIESPHRTTAVEIAGQYPASWIAHHCRKFRQAGWHTVIW